jgi:hypothetical protein
MKNKILFAAVAAAGAAFVAYLVTRKGTVNNSPETVPAKRSHHLTTIFAQAKKHIHTID